MTVSVRGRRGLREAVTGYLFIAPWIVGFVMFLLFPIVITTSLGFFKYDLSRATFVGLENYKTIVFDDELFWKSLQVTFTYAGFAVPLGLVLGLALALLLNQKIRGVIAFRAIYYLPAIIGGVPIAMVWRWMFNPRFGLINFFLDKAGIVGPSWLASERWALPAMIIMSMWGVGWNMLIYLAALQEIPTQLEEAATIDGAGIFSRFIHITLPLISAVVLFNLVIGIINSFQVFTWAYVMTGGGPNNSTLFYALNLYNQSLKFGKFGYASALGTILLGIMIALTFLVFKTSSRWVFYRGAK